MIRNLAFIAALLLTAAPVVADAQVRLPPGAFELAQGRGRQDGPQGQRGGQVIGMERAVAIARGRAGGGQVLDASLAGPNYRVRIRTQDGRVIDFIIDPQSGAILAMDGG